MIKKYFFLLSKCLFFNIISFVKALYSVVNINHIVEMYIMVIVIRNGVNKPS